jgi:hypothetical protein
VEIEAKDQLILRSPTQPNDSAMVAANLANLKPGRPAETAQICAINQTAAAEQAQDLFTVLKWQEQQGARPELIGLEHAGVWTQIVGAMRPNPVKPRNLPTTDAEWLRTFPAPGIRWALRH